MKPVKLKVCGLLLLLASSCSWARLPADLPPQQLDWHWHEQRPAGQVCSGYYLAPDLDLPETTTSIDQARLFAEAEQLDYSAAGGLDLQGRVRLRQGPVYLLSDQAWVNAERSLARLTGNLELRQQGFLLRAQQADYHLASHYLLAKEAHYLMHSQHVRGAAWRLEQLPDGRVRMQNASMTTCAPEDSAWRLVASRIDLNQKTGFGDAYHVRMEVQKVPIFYLPWVRFPIDDRRHTGLLAPSFSYSLNAGELDFIQPFYWNLAPNLDATFYPRYLTNRGVMLGTELRYLQASDAGEVFYAFMDQDDDYLGLRRWQFAAQHQGHWPSSDLSYSLDFSQASDHRYFDDLGRGPFDADENLLQQFRLNYDRQNWQLTAQVSGYQQLRASYDPNTEDSRGSTFSLFDVSQGRVASQQDYFQLPQIELRAGDRWGQHLSWRFLADATYFDKLADRDLSDEGYYTQLDSGRFYSDRLANWGSPPTWRVHLQPEVAADWSWPWAYLRPRLQLKHSRYWIEPNWAADTTPEQRASINSEPSVTAPVYSLDTGLFFERNAQVFGQTLLQTLEPRLFAAYIPYVEQYDVPQLFDGSFNEFDINHLYRAERTGGRDRVGDVQKVTLGVTQRLLNDHSGREIASLAVAQEFYFSDRYVTDSLLHPEDARHPRNLSRDERPYQDTRERSNLVFQANWNISAHLQLRSTLLWDDHLNLTDTANTRLAYRNQQGVHLNLGYSYVSNYQQLQLTGPRPDSSQLDAYSYSELAEEQVYVSGVLPVYQDAWRVFFKHTRDFKRNEDLDRLFGIEYTSCCWQAQLIYRDWIKNPDDFSNPSGRRERDEIVLLQINLRGMGAAGQSSAQLLQTEIQGYAERPIQ